MISKTKIAYAENILNLMLNDFRATQVEASVEMFENCREQGYRICNYDYNKNDVRTIAFSENRNSDSIVVYHSKNHEEYAFGYSDDFWSSRKFFDYNNFEGAVDYIFELMGISKISE